MGSGLLVVLPFVLLVALPGVATPTVVQAQDAGVGSGSVAAPTDIVRLRNGGMARGTIIEVVPGDHVLLLLPGGETRRFQMADVVYSGPIEQDVTPADTPAQRASAGARPSQRETAGGAGSVRLTLEASGSGISFYAEKYRAARAGHHFFQRLCEAPCEFSIAPGRYRLGLSRGAGQVVSSHRVFRVTDALTLHGTYRSRIGVRVGGWIMFGLMAPAAVAGFVAGARCDGCDGQTKLFVLGTAFLLAALLGLVMTGTHDSAHVEIAHAPSWGHANAER